MRIDETIARLDRPEPCARRMRNELIQIHDLCDGSHGRWAGRVVIDDVKFPGPAWDLTCKLNGVPGYVHDGGLVPHDQWTVHIMPSRRFPLIGPPTVVFEEPFPFTPHVFAGGHADDPELEAYLKRGRGACCYVSHGQWASTSSMFELAYVIWTVSRIVTLDLFHAEARTLNPVARNHFHSHPEQRPVGPALPPTVDFGPAVPDETAEISWEEE